MREALAHRRRELPGLAVLLGFLLVGFDQVNSFAPERTGAALAHGRDVLRLEHALGFFPEGPASRWLLQHHLLALAANWTYNTCQIAVTSAVILWIWWRHRVAWRSLRWVLLGTNLVALLVFWTYPVAPPRLLSGSGVVDTIARVPVPFGWPPGIQPHEPAQFQALPSLHLAWAAWVCVAVWSTSRRAAPRILAVLYPAVVAVVVVATGAHSIVDVAAGVATTALLLALRSAFPARRRTPVPTPEGVHDGIRPWTSASSPNRSKVPPMTTS